MVPALLVAIDVAFNGESTPFAVPLALWGAGGLLIDNELRAVIAAPDGIWFPGHEDGPLTHSGDGDPTQIHATGIIGSLPR